MSAQSQLRLREVTQARQEDGQMRENVCTIRTRVAGSLYWHVVQSALGEERRRVDSPASPPLRSSGEFQLLPSKPTIPAAVLDSSGSCERRGPCPACTRKPAVNAHLTNRMWCAQASKNSTRMSAAISFGSGPFITRRMPSTSCQPCRLEGLTFPSSSGRLREVASRH